MKKSSISIAAALVLFFCMSTVQAQNQSDQNSNVIYLHHTYIGSDVFSCPKYGSINVTITVHQIMKTMSDGTLMYHLNVYGEGYDENGDEWTLHHAWVGKYPTQRVRSLTLQGPKGAKLKLRGFFVTNGKGEIVQDEFDLSCK